MFKEEKKQMKNKQNKQQQYQHPRHHNNTSNGNNLAKTKRGVSRRTTIPTTTKTMATAMTKAKAITPPTTTMIQTQKQN